jgi:hypothetical protein
MSFNKLALTAIEMNLFTLDSQRQFESKIEDWDKIKCIQDLELKWD